MFTACSGSPDGSVPNIEQDYAVATMSKHGISCNFYFHYSTSEQNEIDQINKRLNEELLKISDESTLIDMINAIDSIGPKIESEINDEFDLRNLEVLEIGIPETIREHIKTKVNVDRVKAITSNDVQSYASHNTMKSQEKSMSKDLSLVLRTKYDSEVRIEYAIYYHKQGSSLPVNSLNHEIKQAIVDSLHKFEIYEIQITKRDSITKIMTDIIKTSFPETNRVVIQYVHIPENAKKHFLKIDKARKAIVETLYTNGDKIIELTQELESNEMMSQSEIHEIEKEIKTLEMERALIQKKMKLLTYEFKP